jgi:uncharacterized repeat protein (TIGR01451 family)
MKIKRWSLGLGALVVIASVPLLTETPVLANLQAVGESISEVIFRPELKLQLGAEKQVVEMDGKNQPQVKWEKLEGKVTVNPEDVLRYTLQGQNVGNGAAKELVLTQPIPNQTKYEIGSATNGDYNVTYSIDGGQTYVADPTIEITYLDGTKAIVPAPAEFYTHIKWESKKDVEPEAQVAVSYNVEVELREKSKEEIIKELVEAQANTKTETVETVEVK